MKILKYNNSIFRRYKLNKNFKAFVFNEEVMVTYLQTPVMASIPFEAFESENSIEEFLKVFNN